MIHVTGRFSVPASMKFAPPLPLIACKTSSEGLPFLTEMSLFGKWGRGSWKDYFVTFENVTIGLGRVGVKVNLDNVTEYDVFFLKASLINY